MTKAIERTDLVPEQVNKNIEQALAKVKQIQALTNELNGLGVELTIDYKFGKDPLGIEQLLKS